MANRRERRHRQTYPGPNPEDNQQMLQDIKDSIFEPHAGGEKNGGRSSAGSEREMRGVEKPLDKERPESRQSRERGSPPSDREQVSPGASGRLQQNRSTPTKQLSQGSSDRNKQLREIRRSLRPYARSDPGFSVSKDQVNKAMLDQLIGLGHSEVGKKRNG